MRRSMGAAWGMNASRQCSARSHEPETASAPKEWYIEVRLERRGGLEQVSRRLSTDGPRRIVERFDVLLRVGDHVLESS